MAVFSWIILLVGFSGIVAQVLILRELLVSFYGNELTLGLILANWMILEAFGVFLFGKLIERAKNKLNIFVNLQILFSLSLPFCIYLARTFKTALGMPLGEALGLPAIFFISFFINLPLGFCHGALFSTLAKLYSSFTQGRSNARAIGKVYTYETIGSLSGSIVLTYFFIPYLNSFQIVFLVAFLNLFACLFFFRDISKWPRLVCLFFSLMLLAVFFSGMLNYISRLSIGRQWARQKVIDYQNSVYGNVVVTQRQNQKTFFYNGIPVITTPFGDTAFMEDFGNLPLLFHPQPKNICIIASGSGGLINEFLKHPLEKIDYAELDPMMISMLKKHPAPLTQRELSDPRVNVVNVDGRFFLRTTKNKYDLILIGISQPLDLTVNRLFTQEFFLLAKERLNPEGILAFHLPGSLTYLSQEMKDLNACILNGLKNVYAHINIIPGDYNIFLASAAGNLSGVDASLIQKRIEELQIKTNTLTPGYLEYRLSKRWKDWWESALRGATNQVNRDLRPFAVFKMLTLWNKQFSPVLARIFTAAEKLKVWQAAIFIALLFFGLAGRKRNLVKINLAYSIATTGFFGLLANLILIFSYQVFYGYLYYRIGLLIGIFMAGIALGSLFMTRKIEIIKARLPWFIFLEALILIFSYSLSWLVSQWAPYSAFVFAALFFICGFFLGLEFPLASKIYLSEQSKVGETAGFLYFADLCGGWVAGMLGGILLLPILGVFQTCLIIVILKLSSIILLWKTFDKARI